MEAGRVQRATREGVMLPANEAEKMLGRRNSLCLSKKPPPVMMSICSMLFLQLVIEMIKDNRPKRLNPFLLIIVRSVAITTCYGQFIGLRFQLSFILLSRGER
jgi:hypothetical protein